ncbi:MAG: Matrixin [Proteobacteria bacterium]|nr:Matrixin [Pseudomonadota bacterium]
MKPAGVRLTFCAWLLLGCLAGLAPAQERTNGFALADFLLVPLRVHLLTATNEPAVHTTLTSNDVTRILGKVNRVWMQAGLTFYLESLRVEPATNTTSFRETVKTNAGALMQLRPAASLSTNVFHVYYLKQFGPNGICIREINFVKDTASLRAVEGGIDEPLPRVTAHELGHALTLPHRQNVTNLLASGTTGTWLNEEEIKQVRASAKERSWVESAAAARQRAEQAQQRKQSAEARALLRRLASIPLTGREADSIKLLSVEPQKSP